MTSRFEFRLELSAVFFLMCLCGFAGAPAAGIEGREALSQAAAGTLPSLDEALAAREDVWGLAAMRQRNGPSYEFFAGLLPPLRYVNAKFRYYPIVLGASGSAVKARLVSNGSGINARAELKTWKDPGLPVTFRVGDDRALYGEDLSRLNGPHLDRGYLPMVNLSYEHDGMVYEEECFAATAELLAEHGIVFVRMQVAGGKSGKVSATLEARGPLVSGDGRVTGANGAVLAWFNSRWKWEAERRALEAVLKPGQQAVLVVATKPVDGGTHSAAGSFAPANLQRPADGYNRERKDAVHYWKALIGRGAQIEVPEIRVNNAWRALLVNNFALVVSNRPHYSSGNLYDRVYEAECGDTTRAFLLYGYTNEAARQVSVLLDYARDELKYHNAGFKLQNLAHYYWVTRDRDFMRSVRSKCESEVRLILEAREAGSELLPRERYCGDIGTPVYSLHANGACWRGLRDYAAVLADLGERAEAGRLSATAAGYRRAILAVTDKSERRDVQPPFIPVALFGEEKPSETLTASMLGSYWCLMAPYMLGSGMFGPGSDRERAVLDYLHEHGGVCMGMIRFHQHSGLFANEDALDDLYGLRYDLKLLERDEVERALVSFYGKLAQGLTRETFVGAEGTGLRPLDRFGRPMYLPPNSTAQGYFLWMLRYLLVQDCDLDDDGTPETLRLGFATPKAWLEDGKRIKVERAPTAFGPVSFSITSRLKQGEIMAEVELPTRDPARAILLRIRVPDGSNVVSARAGRRWLAVDDRGTVDISPLEGHAVIRFQTRPATGR